MDIDGVCLHYHLSRATCPEQVADGVIVMIHGLSGSVYDFYFSPMYAALNKKYDIVLVDRPGAGYSYITTRQIMNLDKQSYIIHQLLQHLNVDNPIILGHSLGGALALNYATLFPDHAMQLVLLAPLIFPVRLMYFPLNFFMQFLIFRFFVFGCIWIFQYFFFAQLMRNAFRPRQDCLQQDYQEATRDQLFSFTQFFAEFSNLIQLKESIEQQMLRYADLKTPIVLLAGDRDTIIPAAKQAQKLKQMLPHIHLEILNRHGHMLNFSATQEILNAFQSSTPLND